MEVARVYRLGRGGMLALMCRLGCSKGGVYAGE